MNRPRKTFIHVHTPCCTRRIARRPYRGAARIDADFKRALVHLVKIFQFIRESTDKIDLYLNRFARVPSSRRERRVVGLRAKLKKLGARRQTRVAHDRPQNCQQRPQGMYYRNTYPEFYVNFCNSLCPLRPQEDGA